MIRNFQRCFTSQSRCLTSFYARSLLSPQNYKFVRPQNFNPASVVVFSTPNNLPRVIDESIKAFQNDKIEVYVAGVDSILNSCRDGVSELWLDEAISVKDSILLEDRDDLNNQPRESDGVNIVVARKNWKSISSNFNISIGNKHNVDISLANTVFSTEHLVTLFYFNNSCDENSGKALCELSITLPEIAADESAVLSDKWVPLYEENSPELFVTDCAGNLVKLVNSKSAAGYLENNEKLMSIGSKETEVYVKLYKKGQDHPLKYQVIAGGGGWGAKANIIVLSPDAKLSKGDRIEFFMLTPEDRYQNVTIDTSTLQNKFMVETTHEQVNYNHEEQQEQLLQTVFACGSEQGFRYNGIKHGSAGERLAIDLK